MPLQTQSLEFGDFLLDIKEKVLLRNGERLPINPKTFQLLIILIENHGHLVEKDRLMEALWADSFVEEANLAFTVSLLRKTLGDDAAHPQFIETVPRRGYRFIADVRESRNGSHNERTGVIPDRPAWTRFRRFRFAAMIVLAAGVVFSGYWIVGNATDGSSAPILTLPFASEQLSTNGKVHHAVISSDGTKVFYTNGIEGQQSVWLRQLESSQSVEIIPPSDDFYYGLTLSPDGNILYFARSGRQVKDIGVYRISIFGGVPTKIISGSEGWISISADGNRISFVRCPYTKEENCSLYVADALTGQNERKLTSRPRPFRIGDNEFSPDGRTLAFAVGQSQNQSNEFGLTEIDIESGEERSLTSEKFFNIWSLAWLPNKSGLLITASKTPNRHFRIWEVSAASGSVEPLTNDGESYQDLSLNAATDLLISTQVKTDFRLSILNRDDPSGSRVLMEGFRAMYFPNGKLVFQSAMSGNDEIWSANSDGTGQKQLTNDPSDDTFPVVSPDNEFIFYAANRTGVSQIWRMKADGSDQTQLTSNAGGYPFFVSPDGKWVYYHNAIDRTLWRVSTDGGDEELVLNKRALFAISPDVSTVAYSTLSGKEKLITTESLVGEKATKTFTVEHQEFLASDIAWMPDGNAFVYLSPAGGRNNTALMLQRTDDRSPTKIADLGDQRVSSVAVSPDGKSFAIVQGSWKHDAVLLKGLN